MTNKINQWLQNAHPFCFSLFVISGAFITYFSMYAFRKPFSAGIYDDLYIWGFDYKVIALISQVCGYALSKFIGIKVISELKTDRRIISILGLIGIAWTALLLFAVIPQPYNVIALFFNGLPLGMIWGVVFSFLEGRRFTEILGAGLCASFIVASGVVKAIGRSLVFHWGISEFWMPFLTGMIFIPPLLIGVAMLKSIPAPSTEDEFSRTRRVPMDQPARLRFLSKFAFGIALTTLIYVALTIFRDIRDNFAVEIWRSLGYGDTPHILATAEIPIAAAVLIIISMMSGLKNNRSAFYLNFHIIIATGLLLLFTTWLFQSGSMNPVVWMIGNGFCMYLAYIAFHTFLYERWIALFRYKSNIGFLMYIADAFGYLGSISVMFIKNFGKVDISWFLVFRHLAYITGLLTVLLGLVSFFYFRSKENPVLQTARLGELTNG